MAATSSAARRIWRIVLLGAVVVVVAAIALLGFGIALGKAHEEQCPQRAPEGATTAGYPEWVAPTTFRCDYGRDVPAVTFHDARPLGVALAGAAATAGMLALFGHRLLRRP